MENLKKLNFEEEAKLLISRIKEIFESVPRPKQFENLNTVDDFLEKFGADFFLDFWKYFYHLKKEEVKYLFPFVLENYTFSYDFNKVESAYFEIFINQLGLPINEKDDAVGIAEIFDSFTEEQFEAVCLWLKFIKNMKLSGASDIDNATQYWCKSG